MAVQFQTEQNQHPEWRLPMIHFHCKEDWSISYELVNNRKIYVIFVLVAVVAALYYSILVAYLDASR
jgi:hypothetical protein